VKYLVFIFFCCSIDFVFSQTISAIQTDRPDQTECPFIVPVKYFQIENGFAISNSQSGLITYNYPSSLLKYGVNEKFELRLVTEYNSFINGSDVISGIMPIKIGFKVNLCKERGIIPHTSFIGHLATSKIGYKAFHANYLAPLFRFTMQHTLSKSLTLGYNIGYEWSGESPNPELIYTITTGYNFTDKFGGYIELYNESEYEIFSGTKFDGGFTYLISNDFMMDVSGGFEMSNYKTSNFLSLGFSYRLKAFK
jgi:hypothetical protein